MKITVKRGSNGVWKRRAKAISRGLEAIAREGARTAELHARRGLMLNVYSTERGAYSRSRFLLGQVYASGQANGTSLGIVVGDRADYASKIEFGTGPYELSPKQLAAYLDAMPPGGLLTFGRSGKAYLLPGPYIGPALRWAQYKTHVRLRALLQGLWA